MNREIRRKDREITDIEECKSIIRNNKLGFLSTISEDNTPYVVPLNYFYDGENIYFHSATEGHKVDNIKKNPKVCFCVVGDHEIVLEKFTTKYESAIIYGNAVVIEDFQEKVDILNGFMKFLGREVDVTKHYKSEVIDNKTLIVKINVDKITGKKKMNK